VVGLAVGFGAQSLVKDVISGAFFLFVGSYGLAKLPDMFRRLHGPTKASTLGIGSPTVERIMLAGAFGSHIDPLHAMVLGMVPDGPVEGVRSVGNAAGAGAVRALVSGAQRAEMERVVRAVRKVETATELEQKTNLQLKIAALYRDKLDAGLSPSTIQKMHPVIHKTISQAVRWDLIARNPAASADPPKVRHEEITPLSTDQARVFLDAARGQKYEALYVLSLTCGLRMGEALGLKWSDMDLDAGILRVNRQLQRIREGGREILRLSFSG
jgi:hypothetical protein